MSNTSPAEPLEENKPQRAQLSPASVQHLIDTLTLDAIRPYSAHPDGPRRPGEMRFRIPQTDAVNKSGVPGQSLGDTVKQARYPMFRACFDDDARGVMADHSAIYGNQGELWSNYSLSVSTQGTVKLKLDRIIARERDIGVFSPNELDLLSTKAGELIAERHAREQSATLAQKAMNILGDIGNVLSEIETRTNPGAANKTTVKSFKSQGSTWEGAMKFQSNDAEQQLALMSAADCRIMLPIEQLSQYAEIKKLMENAGGTYTKKKDLAYFKFDEGVDACDVLKTLQSGKAFNIQQDTQFFATPTAVGNNALATLGDLSGKTLLEPSGGDGAMADLAKAAGAHVTVVENWNINAKKLAAKGYEPVEKDFLSLTSNDLGSFDAVLMNPPFSNRQDIAHVKHALSFLNSEGELTAIISPQFQSSKIKVSDNFRALMDLAQADITPIDKGAFKESGTGISTVMVHLKMVNLIAALNERNESDAQYGIDLSVAMEHAASAKTSKLKM